MGALRDGFEVVQTLSTDEGGRINGMDTVRVTVPDWVQTDRPYLIMITDPEYNPLASADMFHPTTPEGSVVRRGTIRFEDPACPTLTAAGEEIYFLVGDVAGLGAGERIVRGKLADSGRCGNVTTIEVAEVRLPPR